jgi:hypothetical protein
MYVYTHVCKHTQRAVCVSVCVCVCVLCMRIVCVCVCVVCVYVCSEHALFVYVFATFAHIRMLTGRVITRQNYN